MRSGKAIVQVLCFVLGVTAAQHVRADQAINELHAIAKLCGINGSTRDRLEQQKFTNCLKSRADSGHLYPPELILGLAGGLQGEGRHAEALEYLAYWYAVEATDLNACRYGSGWATYGRGDAFVMFGSSLRDPSLTADNRREAVRRALALEDATAATRPHHPSYCVASAGQKPPGGSMDDLYVSDSVWRQRRIESLRNIEPLLLVVVGLPRAPQKP